MAIRGYQNGMSIWVLAIILCAAVAAVGVFFLPPGKHGKDKHA